MKDRFHPLSTIGFASYILLCSIDRFFLPIPLAVYLPCMLCALAAVCAGLWLARRNPQ